MDNEILIYKKVIDGSGKMYPYYDTMDEYNKKAIDIMVCQGTKAAMKYLIFIEMKNQTRKKNQKKN